MTRRDPREMMAHALEMPEALLPFAPELLADLDELGSDPDLIVEVLGGLGIGPESSVVDLGCGKGAVAVEIARTLGCSVLGIDLHDGLVAAAVDAAVRAGVADRCRFVVGDVSERPDSLGPFDIAVYAALGTVLGPWNDTVGVVRRWVRPGGLIVIDDGYLLDDAGPVNVGFEAYETLAGTRSSLESHGDVIVGEVLEAVGPGDSGDGGTSTEELLRITARARELVAGRPDLQAAVDEFLRTQGEEYAFIERSTAGAVWVVQRPGGEVTAAVER